MSKYNGEYPHTAELLTNNLNRRSYILKTSSERAEILQRLLDENNMFSSKSRVEKELKETKSKITLFSEQIEEYKKALDLLGYDIEINKENEKQLPPAEDLTPN